METDSVSEAVKMIYTVMLALLALVVVLRIYSAETEKKGEEKPKHGNPRDGWW